MIWMILFEVIILVAAVASVYTLTLLDEIVHIQLYNYGLQFSLGWANPYWIFFRTTLALLGLVIVFTAVEAIFTFRRYFYAQKPIVRSHVKKASTLPAVSSTAHVHSSPSISTTGTDAISVPSQESSRLKSSGLIKCFHCNRIFTHPLQMLDFQGDKPRIVNICPSCNEVIPTTPVLGQKEHDKRFHFEKKNNNHVAKTSAH